METRFYNLKNLLEIKYGKSQKNIEEPCGKYPILGTGGVIGHTNQFLYDKPSVLIGRKGTIDKIQYIEQPFWTIDTLFYTIINEKLIIPKFLYYRLLLVDLTLYNEGTSIPSLTTKTLYKLEIDIPTVNIQKKILKILNNLDKKIEINKKINKNLENQILALFKKCFFNFDFKDTPLEGMNIRMKSSEWGNIPETWEIKYLDDKQDCPIIKSGIDKFDHEKIYIATADVNNSTIINNNTLITMNNKPSRANMQPIKKSIWFAKMIDSRKLIMVDDKYSSILNNYIFSTGFCGLNCSNELFYYLWTFLLTDRFNNMKDILCNGTTMQAINNTNVKNISYIKPDNEILNYFNKIAKPIYDKIHLNKLENTYLTKLRDNLLPKLMSGELDVSQVEL